MRVVLTADGRVELSRTAPGRGAWLCRPPAGCAELALRRKGFERAWRRAVPDTAKDDVRRMLTGPWDEQMRKVE